MEQGTFMDLIRWFFAFLDGIIYNLIGDAYNLIIEIAHYKVFENIDFFVNKVYAVLGIFMLFKVSFSFINYLINPDSFTDKEKGVQHIIKNIVIMFAMLIACPWAFKTLWTLQADILDEGIIENFIFGEGDRSLREYKMMDECSEFSTAGSNGDYIALMTLKGFYKPYTAEEVGYDLSSNEYDTDYSEVKKALCTRVVNGTPSMYLIGKIYNADADVNGTSILSDDLDIYIMDYKIGISTAVGVVVLLILVSFAMDVGVRVVKLSFLELLSPIPIVSYIDPASGKNGMFKKWLKEVGSTWVSIFIRLLAVFFSVRVIQEIGHLQHISDPGRQPSVWVLIFVIIGSLMFAKQLPKLIQNITGINLDGGFSLNPLKKVSDQALGGKRLLGLGAAGFAATASGLTNFATRAADKNTWKDGVINGVGRTVRSTIAGATSSGYRTFNKVSKDGKIISGVKGGHLEAMFAKQQREDLSRRGSTMGGRMRADANRWIGRLNEAQQNILDFDDKDKKIKAWENSLKARKETATDGYKEYADLISKMDTKIDNQRDVKSAKEAIEALKQAGGYYDATGAITTAGQALDAALKTARQNAYTQVRNDADMRAWQARIRELVTTRANLATYSSTGINADGTINKAQMYMAQSSLAAAETQFVSEEAQLSNAKEALQQAKDSYRVKAAEADNASRKITGPQPEGWKPSTNVNAGGTTGYGPNQYYGPGGPPSP